MELLDPTDAPTPVQLIERMATMMDAPTSCYFCTTTIESEDVVSHEPNCPFALLEDVIAGNPYVVRADAAASRAKGLFLSDAQVEKVMNALEGWDGKDRASDDADRKAAFEMIQEIGDQPAASRAPSELTRYELQGPGFLLTKGSAMEPTKFSGTKVYLAAEVDALLAAGACAVPSAKTPEVSTAHPPSWWVVCEAKKHRVWRDAETEEWHCGQCGLSAFVCEGCRRSTVRLRTTADDVELCEECFQAVPIVGPRAGAVPSEIQQARIDAGLTSELEDRAVTSVDVNALIALMADLRIRRDEWKADPTVSDDQTIAADVWAKEVEHILKPFESACAVPETLPCIDCGRAVEASPFQRCETCWERVFWRTHPRPAVPVQEGTPMTKNERKVTVSYRPSTDDIHIAGVSAGAWLSRDETLRVWGDIFELLGLSEAMIPKGKGLPKYADGSTLNQIRGKAMVGHQSIEDVWTLLDHLQLLEHVLDEEIDMNNGLGTEGWRHHMQAVGAGWR